MHFIATPLARIRTTLFVSAGALMLMSVLLIAIARFHLADIPTPAFALPAMGAQIASLLGLLGLHPALAKAPFLAWTGFIATTTAGLVFIGGIAVVATAGSSSPAPTHVAAYAYTCAISLAFALNAAAAFATHGVRRALGYLLLAPPLAWSPIILVGATGDLMAAISLDLYTNAIIAPALIGIGYVARANSASG